MLLWTFSFSLVGIYVVVFFVICCLFVQLLQHCLLKRLFFISFNVLLLSNITQADLCEPISASSVLFHQSISLCLCKDHTVLFTRATLRVELFLSLVFFVCLIWACLEPGPFHIKFTISLSMHTIKLAKSLIGIMLKLWSVCRKMTSLLYLVFKFIRMM